MKTRRSNPLAQVPEWVSSGALCQSCGICCVDMSTAPITMKDLKRLMKGFQLSFAQALQLGYQGKGQATFLFDMGRGFCKALRVEKAGKEIHYPCAIYEHRPDICRDYQCPVLLDIREYAKKGKVRGSNMFSKVAPQDLKRSAFDAIRFMRSLIAWDFERPDLQRKERNKFREGTRKILSQELVQIENVFPPRPK